MRSQRQNQQQTAPPWTAGAEKDRKRKKIGHAAAQAARLHSQRIEKCGLRKQVREEMVRSASRTRHGGKACRVNLEIIASVGEACAMRYCRANRGEEEHTGNRQ